MSQSLLHQVTYSDDALQQGRIRRMVSQSLLHQVTYSDAVKVEAPIPAPDVSIPFTSGHVFRQQSQIRTSVIGSCLNPFYIRSRIPTGIGPRIGYGLTKSQSLLHQVTYSDSISTHPSTGKESVSIPFTSGHVFRLPVKAEYLKSCTQCLNPFYIRSRIPTDLRGRGGRDCLRCLNPFYIRSRIPTPTFSESSEPNS